MWQATLLAITAALGGTKKPHIVVLYADDLGWGNVGW